MRGACVRARARVCERHNYHKHYLTTILASVSMVNVQHTAIFLSDRLNLCKLSSDKTS